MYFLPPACVICCLVFSRVCLSVCPWERLPQTCLNLFTWEPQPFLQPPESVQSCLHLLASGWLAFYWKVFLYRSAKAIELNTTDIRDFLLYLLVSVWSIRLILVDLLWRAFLPKILLCTELQVIDRSPFAMWIGLVKNLQATAEKMVCEPIMGKILRTDEAQIAWIFFIRQWVSI